MGKLTAAKVDTRAILDRMVAATGFENLAELAKALDISPQALQQTKARQSISLSLLLIGIELAKNNGGTSLDYLVFGTEKGAGGDGTIYISIPRIGGGEIKFPAELLKQGMVAKSLLAYVQGSKLSIIDTTDKTVTDGLYAFGSAEKPALRKCLLRIDSSVLVDGDDVAKTTDDLILIGIIGRVVWSGI